MLPALGIQRGNLGLGGWQCLQDPCRAAAVVRRCAMDHAIVSTESPAAALGDTSPSPSVSSAPSTSLPPKLCRQKGPSRPSPSLSLPSGKLPGVGGESPARWLIVEAAGGGRKAAATAALWAEERRRSARLGEAFPGTSARQRAGAWIAAAGPGPGGCAARRWPGAPPGRPPARAAELSSSSPSPAGAAGPARPGKEQQECKQ